MKDDPSTHREDSLLHRLAEHTAGREDAGRKDTDRKGEHPPSNAVLEAFAEGQLGSEEGREIAGHLAHSREARHRLLELRGVDPAGPSPELRRRVLASAARTPARRGWARPMVAALAAALLVAIGWGLLQPRTLPSGLAYDLRVQGVAEIRDGEAASRLVAGAETQLRFDVTPRDLAERRVAFAIYRQAGPARLERVQDSLVRLEVDRGAATLRVRAGDVLGETPGEYPVWIVVARPGDLPAAVDLSSGDSPAQVLASDGRRRAYRSIIELVSDPLAP